jgi:subtilisin family serine protease
VARVQAEHRARLRYEPNDPALVAPETAPGTAPGTTVEWWAARTGLPRAWDFSRGDGATVAVIDTGADMTHPDLAGRVAAAHSFDAQDPSSVSDVVGHGTHVASLACGAGDNGVGMVGAGMHCRLLVVKSDFSDSSVAASIVWAVDHGADAINMSFGTDPGTRPAQALRQAVDYAVAHRVVLVAAAADQAIGEQGYPANLLQPRGTGRRLRAGKGLSVTAADAADGRAPFAGLGSEISLAAYGAYGKGTGVGPRGIFGAFTAARNELETGTVDFPPRPPCLCRAVFAGDGRYAYLQGTSMATPIVAGTAALVRDLNPDLTARQDAAVIKATARRAGGWTRDLGWGILDAGRALARAASIDRGAPVSRAARLPARTRRATLLVRWTSSDPAPPGVRSAGVARVELWRSIDGGPYRRVADTAAGAHRVRLPAGHRYAFYTVAVDGAHNRERAPSRPDARVAR